MSAGHGDLIELITRQVLEQLRGDGHTTRPAPGRPVMDAHDPETCERCRNWGVSGVRGPEETRALAANNGIEIAFRPVPSAGLMLPHRVVIPTIAGDAVLQAAEVSIVTNNRDRVAFVDE